MKHSGSFSALWLFVALCCSCCCSVALAQTSSSGKTIKALSRDDPIVLKMQERLQEAGGLDLYLEDDLANNDEPLFDDETLQALAAQVHDLLPDDYDNSDSDQALLHRKLLDPLFPPYKTPKWWGRYKALIGRPYIRKCNKWIIDHMEPPRSGSLYCPKYTGNYTCFFGEQRCPELGRAGHLHPDQQCTCEDKEWRCKDWSCPEPFYYHKCPAKSPLEMAPDEPQKCLGSFTCDYGTETCCGQTSPSVQCDCVDGEFQCRNTDACLSGQCGNEVSSCPAEIPDGLGQSYTCKKDLECSYNPQRCCPKDNPVYETTCTCSEGEDFSCSPRVAFDCIGICPDDKDDDDDDKVNDPQCPADGNFFTGDCTDDFECNYGELRCCPGDASVGYAKTCTCSKGSPMLCSVTSISCAGDCPVDVAECPAENPVTSGGKRYKCDANTDLTCSYGEQRCCDGDAVLGPDAECSCTAGGELICTQFKLTCTKSCPVETSQCPAENPLITKSRFKCTEDIKDCTFGELRCCPEDDPLAETECACDSGDELKCKQRMLDCDKVKCRDPVVETSVCPQKDPLQTGKYFDCAADLKEPLSCSYGEFRCCDTDDPVSTTDCFCDAGGKLECFQKQFTCPAVECPLPVEQCPEKSPLEIGVAIYCDEALSDCNYGELRCCPNDDPITQTICSCEKDDIMGCTERAIRCTGDCPAVNVDTCPSGNPFGSNQVITCEKKLECLYGEFRCCPDDDPVKNIECSCDEGGEMVCEQQRLFCPAVVCDSLKVLS